jgi:enterochelin esterase family protein
MKNKSLTKLILVFTFCAFYLVISGQQNQNFTSPEVHKDRRVTFRLMALNANDVKLNTQFVKGPQTMTKGENGLWSITLGPADPDIYPYCFVVDGIQLADPKNS